MAAYIVFLTFYCHFCCEKILSYRNNPNDQEKIKAACRANITKGPKYNGKRSFRVFASEFEIWRAANRVSIITDVDFQKFLLLS